LFVSLIDALLTERICTSR